MLQKIVILPAKSPFHPAPRRLKFPEPSVLPSGRHRATSGTPVAPRDTQSCAICGTEYTGDVCPRCALAIVLEKGAPDPDDKEWRNPWELGPPEKLAHYRIEKRVDGSLHELGHGGMGVTYKAFDERLRLAVALKVITPVRVHDPAAQSLFLREARAAARVRHSNVASVLFLNDTPGAFFYAMEFVEGESLEEWSKARGPVPPLLAINLVEQIARGLGAIHVEGIIHRDLKPSNVMLVDVRSTDSDHGNGPLEEAWLAKIIDFGLARPIQRKETETQSIGFRGTALYASPEQCEERPDLDGRSDLYSLGCILWQLLAGGPVFAARTHRELMNYHVGKAAPVERLGHLPASLVAIVTRLLLKNPKDRYANCAAVVVALERSRILIADGKDRRADTVTDWPTESSSDTTPTSPDSGDGIPPVRRKTSTARGSAVAQTRPVPVQSAQWKMVARGAAILLMLVLAVIFVLGTRKASDGNSKVAVVPTTLAVTKVPRTGATDPRPPEERSGVAVLPFSSSTATPEATEFADGMHEDILTSLAMIRGLRVISRTSVLGFRSNKATNLKEIAERLGVRAILEGSVQRAGENVRFNVRLLDPNDEKSLWAQRFDRPATEVFAVQNEIALRVAEALGASPNSSERLNLERAGVAAPGAYENYLKAKKLVAAARGPKTDLSKAQQLLEDAIRIDPRFARGHAMLSIVHTYRYDWGSDHTDYRLGQAIAEAKRAVETGGDFAEGNVAFGIYFFRGIRDYQGALKFFQKALALEPQNAEALASIANIQRRVGSWNESLDSYRAASRVNPLDPILHYNYANTLLCMRRYMESLEIADGARERIGHHPALEVVRNDIFFYWKGDIEPLRNAAFAAQKSEDSEEARIWRQVHILLLEGNHAAARRLTEQSGFVILDVQRIYVSKDALLAEIAEQEGNRRESTARWQSVTEDYTPLVSTRREDPRISIQLAFALAGTGQFEAALKIADNVVTMPQVRNDHFDLPFFQEQRALVYLRCGREQEARNLVNEILLKPAALSEISLRASPEWNKITR